MSICGQLSLAPGLSPCSKPVNSKGVHSGACDHLPIPEAPMTNGNVASLTLGSLVLDPALQCRAGIDHDTVSEYCDLMRAGKTFPPIEVIQCASQGNLVVDGWHRVQAAKEAAYAKNLGLSDVTIDAKVAEGTFRDALLIAVQANGDHGLRRTNADRRKAVRALLRDAEWCALSSRDLAALAKVSHTFVGNVRKEYGLKKGAVLTDEVIEKVDGDLPPQWAKLATNHWQEETIRKIRVSTLDGLRKFGQHADAVRLRLAELAVHPWPWPEDTSKKSRTERANGLDVVKDIKAAVIASTCPDQAKLWTVFKAAESMRRAKLSYELPSDAATFKGRPALLDALKKKRTELGGNTPTKSFPTKAVDAFATDDFDGFIAGVSRADLDSIGYIGWQLEGHPLVRERLAQRAEELECDRCPDPRCGRRALVAHGAGRDLLNCLACDKTPAVVQRWLDQTRRGAAELIVAGGELVIDGVQVRAMDVDLLAILQADPTLVEQLRAAAGDSRADALDRWAPPAGSEAPAEPEAAA